MRKIILFSLLFAFSVMIAVIPTSSHFSTTIQNPGTFVEEVSSIAPHPLDPATNYEHEGDGYIQLMYEGLFQYTNNSLTALRPSLATSYTLSSDGLVYTFTLRTGVNFALQPGESVGQPFNAYVMQYSIDRAIIMNDHTGPAWMIQDWIKGAQTVEHSKDLNQTQANNFLALKSVWATDSTHLVIVLSKPFGGFVQTLQYPVAFAVSPKAIIDNKPFQYTSLQDDVYGMVSLASMFPGNANATILSNLGLPSSYNIDNSGIVPQSAFDSLSAYTWLQSHSAGTGPYYLTDIVQGSNVDFSKNPNWWNNAAFPVNSTSAIKIIEVPSDTTRVSDLQSGSIDYGAIPMNLLSDFGVSSTHTASNYTGINSYVYNTLINSFIGMNMNDTLPTGQVEQNTSSMYSGSAYGGNVAGNNYTSLLKFSWKDASNQTQYASPANPFSALLFREAMAYIFPTQDYINQALYGFAIRMQGAIPKGLLGYDDQLIANGNIPTQNLATAKALFNEVGWKGTILFSYDNGSTLNALAVNLLATTINSLNVGITIQPDAIASNFFVSGSYGGQIALFQLGWTPDYTDPNDYATSYYQGGYKFAYADNYDNPYVDNLVQAAASASDPIQRFSLYHQMEVNATGDFPYIYLYQQQNVLLLRDWINGVGYPMTDALNPMLNQLPIQYLAKGSDVPPSQTSNPSSTISTTNAMISTNTGIKSSLSTPGFEVFSFIGFFIITSLMLNKRKSC